MASITSWIRLEPCARNRDMTPGVEARVHDPLWLLCRQWQLGELRGEDGGSAITARARLDVGRIHGFSAESGEVVACDPGALPIAAMAEAIARDAPRPIPDLDRRARTGRQLIRMLAAGGLADHGRTFLAAFPITVSAAEEARLDEQDRRFLVAVRGRAPDGVAAAVALRGSLPGLPAALAAIPSSMADSVATSCGQWLSWYDQLEVAPPAGPAWQADRLEYGFALHGSLAGQRITLAAAEHHGGRLGWPSFDAAPGGTAAAPPEAAVSTSIPAPVRYQGMPARRYWELEDSAIDWEAVNAGPGDIARMLLVDFALVFSDDWLTMPIELDASTLARVASLVVTDTFGVRTRIRSTAELDGSSSPWRLFTMSGPVSACLLALPAQALLEGPAVDRVTLAKDELANLAWAIEQRAARADGTAREVTPRELAAPGSVAPGTGSEGRYRAGGLVAAGWHPFRPVHDDVLGYRLVRAVVPGSAQEGSQPLTALVAGTAACAESEISIHGARIESRHRLVRLPDGRYVGWLAYHRTTSPGTASSGLAFDRIRHGDENDESVP